MKLMLCSHHSFKLKHNDVVRGKPHATKVKSDTTMCSPPNDRKEGDIEEEDMENEDMEEQDDTEDESAEHVEFEDEGFGDE